MLSDTTTTKHVELLESWKVNNSKIITWVNNSVEQSIGMQLAKFSTAKQVWDHLARLYMQSNFAKRYQLEMDIRAARQGDQSIQEFYTIMTGFWDQLALTGPADLSLNASYCTYREEQRLVQFLMALRDDFEALRGSILHRSPLPHVDFIVNELLAEEVRFKSHAGKGILPAPTQTVLAVPSKYPPNGQNRYRTRVAIDECSFCKQKGHWKTQCPKLLSKGSQQISKSKHYHTAATTPSEEQSVATSTLSLIAEQLQKLISTSQPNALSVSPSIGLSSSAPSGISPSTWVFDLGAAYHMANDVSLFKSISSTSTFISVLAANGTPMSLAGIGSIISPRLSLSNVYCIPQLALNLIYISSYVILDT